MLTEGGERDGVGGDGGTEARRGGVGGDGGEAGSGETAARRRRRGIVEENWGRKQRRGIRPHGGLGENSFNSSVGSENALLLKSVVVALFLEGRYYYT